MRTRSPFIFLILMSLLSTVAWGQVQRGSDLYRGNVNDYLGQSIAISADGTRILIASDAADVNTGLVRILDWNTVNLSWEQVGADITGPYQESRFGRSDMSSDGSTVAVGQWTGDGEVKVFRYASGSWSQIGSTILGDYYQNRHGFAMALSANGNRLVISAYDGSYGGELNIFEFNGTEWEKVGNTIKGNLDYAFATDRFGWSVDISEDGNRVIAGGWGNDGPDLLTSDLGYVKVFELKDTTWVQQGQTLYGELEMDRFGEHVSISGDGSRIVIGAPNSYGTGATEDRYAGYVKVFEFDALDSVWVQLGSTFIGGSPYEHLGSSARLNNDGSVLAISATGFDGDSLNRGGIQLYKLINSNWQSVSETTFGNRANGELGGKLDMSPNGQFMMASAFASDQYGDKAGLAQVFETGINWILIASLTAIGGAEDSLHIVAENPLFEYNFSHDQGHDIQYVEVQVSSSESFSNAELWNSGKQYTSNLSINYGGSTLSDGQTYFVRMRAGAYGYYSGWSAGSFRTNTPPVAPSLLSQPITPLGSDSVHLTLIPMADPEGDTLDFHFYLYSDSARTNAMDSLILNDVQQDTLDLALEYPLTENQYYYWALNMYDGYEWNTAPIEGTFAYSSIQEAPLPFLLTSPQDDAQNLTYPILFEWNAAADPDPGDSIRYELIIASDSLFANPLIQETGIMDTTYELTSGLLAGERHYWKIIATDFDDLTTSSDQRAFLVDAMAVSNEENPNLPVSYRLEQNYPNPFNPQTTIAFQIPEFTSVTLRFFNIAGQKVHEANLGTKTAGTHTYQFNGRDLPSGIYFYQIQAGNFLRTKRMMLIK